MPNRILKDSICTSETIDALSVESESFFYRLMVQCDDFGRMDARASVLRARCYPLRLDSVTDAQVSVWMGELQDAKLLWVYVHDGRAYLQITTWDKHQQKRAQHSKYPEPPAPATNGNQLISDASNSPREYENTRSEKSRDETSPAPKTPARVSPSKIDKPDPLKELAAVFEQASGVKLESIPKNRRGALFWNPLSLMLKTANGTAGEELLAAIAHLRKDGMTISDPNSVLKTFNGLHGAAQTDRPFKPGTVYT